MDARLALSVAVWLASCALVVGAEQDETRFVSRLEMVSVEPGYDAGLLYPSGAWEKRISTYPARARVRLSNAVTVFGFDKKARLQLLLATDPSGNMLRVSVRGGDDLDKTERMDALLCKDSPDSDTWLAVAITILPHLERPAIAMWTVGDRVLVAARDFTSWIGGGVHVDGATLRLYDAAGAELARVSTDGAAVSSGHKSQISPAPRVIHGSFCVPISYLAKIYDFDPSYIGSIRAMWIRTGAREAVVPVRDASWRGSPAYMQKVVAYREGRGLISYLTVCGEDGVQTTADGWLELSISRGAKVVWEAKLAVRREMFRTTSIGLGGLAHRETILPIGRIPFDAMENVGGDRDGRVYATFLGTNGEMSDSASVYFD